VLTQIDNVLQNVFVVLLLAQFTAFLKLFFDGTIVSMSFSAFLFGFTLIYYYLLINRPLITPGKFPDESHEQELINLERWYNTYKHPLTMSNHIRSVPKVTKQQNQPQNQPQQTHEDDAEVRFSEDWFRQLLLNKLEGRDRSIPYLTTDEYKEIYEEVSFRRAERENELRKQQKMALIRQPLSRHE